MLNQAELELFGKVLLAGCSDSSLAWNESLRAGSAAGDRTFEAWSRLVPSLFTALSFDVFGQVLESRRGESQRTS